MQPEERSHALLGASKAEQWINCPPSARLQEGIPEKHSDYADEGTAAHELAEIKLRQRILPCNSKQRKDLEKKYEKLKTGKYYCPEMEQAVQVYVDFAEERFMAAKARSSDAVVLVEAHLDFSEWVPEGFGTGDLVLIADGLLEVIDLKYGAGVPVSAQGNPQIRLYGLGAWQEYSYLYNITDICMSIVQPRRDNISSDTMTVDELVKWAETVVKPAAALAYAGSGEFKVGEHCRWCKVKGNCRARADENMKALEYELSDPALLSMEEIGSILFIAEQLQTWAKDVQAFAFDQAMAGNKIPQWKLVEGKSNRTFADKDMVLAKLLEAGYEEGKITKPKELIALGELETKVLGKKAFKELLGDLVIKPPGKPVLVPETDRRPELNGIEQDFANEEFSEVQ